MTRMHRRIREELFAQRRFRQAFVTLVVVSLLLGVAIVFVENSAGTIHTIADGLWWAVTTVTGVGYGDVYPITAAGRVIGALLQIIGLVMTGILVGLITTVLSRRQDELLWSREFDRFHDMHERLSAMETQLKYLVRAQSDAEDRAEKESHT